MFSKLKHDQTLKPVKNAGITGLGKAAQGIMSLIFFALAARTLGAENFGFLVLIHSLVFSASQILRFQSWQAILRYGARALKENDTARLQRLLKFTTGLDLIAGIIGILILQGITPTLATWFGLPQDLHMIAQIYSVGIIFLIMQPSPMGVLRLLDRFDLIALQTIVTPSIRLIGSTYLFFTNGTLTDFLIVWFIALATARIALSIFAIHALKRQNLLNGIRTRFENQLNPEPGIMKFILSHNLSRSLLESIMDFGVLIIGILLGPAAAGTYKIATQIANVLIKPATKFLMPAIYPELSKMTEIKDTQARKTLIQKTILICGLAACFFLGLVTLFGLPLIEGLFGTQYTDAYIPMVILCFAGMITVLSFPLEPVLSTAGRMKNIIAAYATSALLYFTSLYILTQTYGLVGAALAFFIAMLTSTAILFLSGRDLLNEKTLKT